MFPFWIILEMEKNISCIKAEINSIFIQVIVKLIKTYVFSSFEET